MLIGSLHLSSSVLALTTLNGDMQICFYEVKPDNALGPNTYYFRLGPASAYRENNIRNATGVLISDIVNSGVTNSNISADLAQAFGTDWANSGNVRWYLVGGNDQTTIGLLGGEPISSSYVSREILNFSALGATSPPAVAQFNRNILRNNIESLRDYHNGLISRLNTGSQSSNNPNGTFEVTDTSVSGANITTYVPPVVSTHFGIGQNNVVQNFGDGTIPNSPSLEGALDIWRLIGGTPSGTDLTSGFGSGNAVLGTGQYCGTITLDTAGDLRIFGPPLSTTGNYASWATTNMVTGGPDGDSDNDGVKNLVEYALNLNFAGSDGANATGNLTNGLLSFAKRGVAVTNNDVSYAIEESVDLVSWAPVTATSNTATAITYSLPAGSAKKFARLKLVRTL